MMSAHPSSLTSGAASVPSVVTLEYPVAHLPPGTQAAVGGWLSRVDAGIEPLSDLAGAGAVQAFEEQFGAFVGAEFAMAAPSATLALLALLRALGVGPGDEVIVSAYGWGSTLSPILTIGAVPVFADVDADTLGLDAADVLNRITPRTRAVVATHMCGIPCDVAALERVAGHAGIPLLFDAAQALGTLPAGGPVGMCGVASVFSFGHRKLLSLGDGGMVVTNDRRLFAELLRVTQHPLCTLPLAIEYGFADALDEVSLSSRLHGLVATMGCAVLQAVPDRLEQRREACGVLIERLRALPGFRVNGATQVGGHAFHTLALTLVPNELGGIGRREVMALLRSAGVPISAGPVGVPLHLRPRFNPRRAVCEQHGAATSVLLIAEHRCAQTELMIESESRWTQVPKARVHELADAFECVAEQLLRHQPLCP